MQQSDVAEMAVAPEYTGDDLGMTIRLDARTLQEDDGLGGLSLSLSFSRALSLSSLRSLPFFYPSQCAHTPRG